MLSRSKADIILFKCEQHTLLKIPQPDKQAY